MPLSPYFASYKHFKRYAPYIKQIIDAWPSAVALSPAPPQGSVETLASRIPMCVRALRQHIQQDTTTWPLDDFNLAKFLQICDEIHYNKVVKPDYLVCGPEDVVQQMVVHTKAITTVAASLEDRYHPTGEPRIHLNNPSEHDLDALLTIYSIVTFNYPAIVVTTLDIKKMAEPYPNVSIEETSHNTYEVF